MSDREQISPELVLVDPELRAQLFALYAAEARREAEVQRALELPAHSSVLARALAQPPRSPEPVAELRRGLELPAHSSVLARALAEPPRSPEPVAALRRGLELPAHSSVLARALAQPPRSAEPVAVEQVAADAPSQPDPAPVEPPTTTIRPPEPATTPVVPAGVPSARPVRRRMIRRVRPSTAVFAAAAVFLVVTGLLPPKDAPSFADPAERLHVAIAWPRVAGSRSYVLEILDGGSVVWTDLVRGPSVDRELALPGGRTYVWRVYPVVMPAHRSDAGGPIARGTLTLD